MPYHRSTYHCRKCHKGYPDYDEASSCEGDHIVAAAVDAFTAKVEKIMAESKGASLHPSGRESGGM